MFVAWTTVGTKRDAGRMAKEALKAGLAVCVQIEGPILSHYRWKGRNEKAREYRLTFKGLRPNLRKLETFVLKRHPYETPEWVVVRASRISEKYLSWAKSTGTP